MQRRSTKPVWVGDVKVGGDAPITVQSMTKTDTRDVAATVRQVLELEEAGCEIIRCAVPDMEAAKALGAIKRGIHIPLVADIHFHYQLALESLAQGVDCLRLNPGNIRDPGRVRQIAAEAKARDLGIEVDNLGDLIEGEARDVARDMARRVRQRCAQAGSKARRPWVLISSVLRSQYSQGLVHARPVGERTRWSRSNARIRNLTLRRSSASCWHEASSSSPPRRYNRGRHSANRLRRTPILQERSHHGPTSRLGAALRVHER